MKYIIALILTITFTNSYADTTLTFNTFIDQDKSQQLTYYIKDGILRFSEGQLPRINLYNKSRQQFVSIDGKTGNISRIDRNIINQRVEQLNKKRLDRLSKVQNELDKKLQTMSSKEKEIAEELLNQLKYPEFYGAHTQIKVVEANSSKQINQLQCQVYKVTRKQQLIRTICMASAKELSMPADDYDTLRHFYHFNYMTQTQLMIAAGETNFSQIDYQQENMSGIPLEILAIQAGGQQTELLLDSISHQPLETGLFTIPSGKN